MRLNSDRVCRLNEKEMKEGAADIATGTVGHAGKSGGNERSTLTTPVTRIAGHQSSRWAQNNPKWFVMKSPNHNSPEP